MITEAYSWQGLWGLIVKSVKFMFSWGCQALMSDDPPLPCSENKIPLKSHIKHFTLHNCFRFLARHGYLDKTDDIDLSVSQLISNNTPIKV